MESLLCTYILFLGGPKYEITRVIIIQEFDNSNLSSICFSAKKEGWTKLLINISHSVFLKFRLSESIWFLMGVAEEHCGMNHGRVSKSKQSLDASHLFVESDTQVT